MALLFFTGTGCDQSSEERDRAVVQDQQKQYGIAQPIPSYDWSPERDNVIQLYDIRMGIVATHAVWRGDTSIVEGDCPAIGYPIPYDTQLTNPLQVLPDSGHEVVEQAEPNGLFSSKNSTGTWVLCVEGKAIEPVLVEGKVTTYPYPVVVDYTTNRVTRAVGGRSSVKLKVNDKPPSQRSKP